MCCMHLTHSFKDTSLPSGQGPTLSLCSIENQVWAQALLPGVEKASLPVRTVRSSLAAVCVCVCVCVRARILCGKWKALGSPGAHLQPRPHPRVGRTQGACRSGRGVTSSRGLHRPVCTDP